MKKKVFVLFVIFAVMLFVAACGSNEEEVHNDVGYELPLK